MPVPRRRKSHARSRTRKAHDFLTAGRAVTCPQCQSPMRLHRVCMECGYYMHKPVIEVQEK